MRSARTKTKMHQSSRSKPKKLSMRRQFKQPTMSFACESSEKWEKDLAVELRDRWDAYKKDAEPKVLQLGETLKKIQDKLASAGRSGKFSKYLRYAGIPRSTAYKMIELYTSRDGKDDPAKVRLQIERQSLTSEERNLYIARIGIRKAVSNVGDNRKLDILREAIAEEAFETWGMTEPFTLEIRPRESALTLDGRKRTQEKVAA
jgi:hypothetical protein